MEAPASGELAVSAATGAPLNPVGDAAGRIASAVNELADGAGRQDVVLVTRGTDELWDEVAARLRRRGFPVHRRNLDDDDQRWDPPREPARILVHHDPFHARAAVPAGSDLIRELIDAGTKLVFIDFPHGLRDRALHHALRGVYVEALREDPEAMRSRAELLIAALEGTDAVEIVDTATGLPVLRAEVPWQVRSDWTSARRDHPILQLPLGEVWLACTPVWTAAEWCVDGAPPVEIGIGLNARAPWIERTTLAEKTLGAVHLGYGDNELLGGDIRAGWHTDRMLPSRLRLWLEGEHGRRSLDSVLA
ncbi:hypothetical protein PV392_09620 [Streptomyces sp. ME03-5709C]|nr:hypothetical protein [Streptomyces sp. ME03-5709C]